MNKARTGEVLPKMPEPGASIIRTPDQLMDAVHGFNNGKSLVFVKPVATCAEAPPNTAPQPSNFYGTNVTMTCVNISTIPLPPPPPPSPTTLQSAGNVISGRGQSQLDRRRRRRPNPFNSSNRTTISGGNSFSRYRYVSDDARSEPASGNESNIETDSASSINSFNFDPD